MNIDDQLAELEARLDARLDALLRRAADPAGDVSFAAGAGGPAEPTADDELWALVQLAERGEPDGDALSFSAPGEEGRLARARRELTELVEHVVESLTSLAVVETPDGRARVRTRVGWTGDVTTYVEPLATAALAHEHAAAVEARLTTSMIRLRLLTTVTVAAGKIATMLTTPASAVMALPIAYRCVRDIYEQLNPQRENPTTGEASWQ